MAGSSFRGGCAPMDGICTSFADAYLVASAERTGIGVVVSFDRAIDRVGTVRCAEPR